LGFREDSFDAQTRERALKRVDVPHGFQPAGTIDFLGVLYTLTEIFEFASRLAQRGALADAATVTVEMRNVANRLLCSHEFGRFWRSFRPATAERLSFEKTESRANLIARSRNLAVEATMHFFERFGEFDYPQQVLVDEQSRFVDRR
jgi:hypothetical protein